jgi:hypothetical protein
MNIDTGFADRDLVLGYLHDQLVGPVGGAIEVLEERPQQRYLTGILYPISPEPEDSMSTAGSVADESEPADEEQGQLIDDDGDDPIALAGQRRPSSAGVSFVASELSSVDVNIGFGRYIGVDEGDEQNERWSREPVEAVLRLNPDESLPCVSRTPVLEDDPGIEVEVRWRRHRSGSVIVTVVLVNRRRQEPRSAVRSQDCLFQVTIRCSPMAGVINRYPPSLHLRSDEEADELDLLYRKIPVFAVGHGVAAEWDRRALDAAAPEFVQTTFLPVHVVPSVAFAVEGVEAVLDLHLLARTDAEPSAILPQLDAFVDGYQSWIKATKASIVDRLEQRLADAADRLIERMFVAEERMRRGVRLLAEQPRVRQAFGLANQIMLMQMVHSGSELAGKSHSLDGAPEHVDPDYRLYEAAWRPFQLGFLLLTLDGAVNDVPDRELVDLIWFPTGGGKTEAYLGLAAFTIMYRRLRFGDRGAGTTVITRYTLRLLTSQQFQRASTMIMACELIRRSRADELGSRPVSIGLWLGADNSPNSYVEARRSLSKIATGDVPEIGFQIEICPWCGTQLIPEPGNLDNDSGFQATNNSFRVFCRNPRCPFVNEIPISSVDEDLYEHPPTMLVATVDKFASMAWDRRPGIFFGAGDELGPSLVIQDEFHLISGPLGTVVGLYEAAFDVLMARNGAHPKIVAATATIRNADEQARGVYGRRVALFPPSGVDARHSYFVRTVYDTPGRAYAGVMPQGHTPLTGLVHLAAALLQAPVDRELSSEEAKDAYWTLVAYHNSLRELGKTITLAHDDIPERVKIIATAHDHLRELDDDQIVELTSNISARRIPQVLASLQQHAGENNAVSFLASTNMISVGVDVSRLGLMAVVGQPKTTAEYIQATSRVGRSKERPGLVVTLYSPAKPRDRSHYESFVPYHSALYSAVEPTSVTPFSVPARDRALHADLVVLVRHALGLGEDRDAARFDPTNPTFKAILDDFVERASSADPSETAGVRGQLERLIEDWDRMARDAEDDGGLRYRGSGRETPRLLRRFTAARGEGWRTLDSMRSVDVEVEVKVWGARS